MTCGEGEIVLASDGAQYDSLDAALLRAADGDAICVGAGRWETGSELGCEQTIDWTSLTITGAGSDATTLVGNSNECYRFFQDRDSSFALRGFTVEGGSVAVLGGGDIAIEDLVITGFNGADRALWIDGTFDLQDVHRPRRRRNHRQRPQR